MKPPDACRFLSNKAYFFHPPAEQSEATEPHPLSTPFWCLKTHEAVGPDGGDVADSCCGPDRTCFKPEVEI
jgi:hypothetical protein